MAKTRKTPAIPSGLPDVLSKEDAFRALTCPREKWTSFRISLEIDEILNEEAKRWNVSRARALELILREIRELRRRAHK